MTRHASYKKSNRQAIFLEEETHDCSKKRN